MGRRTGRTELGRDRIVRAALRVIDADGADGLTMRRLARDLGTAPMSLYRHVRNKDELLALVAEQVAARLPDLPEPGGDWRATVAAVLRNARLVLLEHPGLASLLGSPVILTPPALRSHAAVLEALRRAGLERDAAARGAAVLWTFTLGTVLTVQATQRGHTAGEAAKLHLRRAAGAGGEDLAYAVDVWGRDPADAVFERGLAALLEHPDLLGGAPTPGGDAR